MNKKTGGRNTGLTDDTGNKGLSRSRRFFFPVLAIFLSIVLVALLLEVGLRLAGYSPGNVNYLSSFHQFDEISGHRGKRNFKGRFKRPEFDVSIAHNTEGFRRQEFLTPDKQQSCRRTIHVFGDSFTWGWGVGQGEMFTDLMNRSMADTCIKNYGIISTGTVAQYELFTREVKKSVKPDDIVLIMFFSNDFDDNVWKGKVRGELQNGTVSVVHEEKPFNSFKDTLEQTSYLFNYLSYKVNLYQLSRKIKKTQSDHARQSALDPADKRYVVSSYFLEAFNRESKSVGARCLVVYIPTQDELGEGGIKKPNKLANDQRFRRAFLDISRTIEIENIDLLPLLSDFKRIHGNQKLTFMVDEHWNTTGHNAVARLLEQYIIKNP
jgi:lysophospholipase L1-like esterase